MFCDDFIYSQIRSNIVDLINGGILPIMYVDFNDATSYPEMHWVLGAGYIPKDILVADTWTGQLVRLSEVYSNPIQRLVYYEKVSWS